MHSHAEPVGLSQMQTALAPSVPSSVAVTPSGGWRDWLGIGASLTCAVHCAAMPFVVGFLPMLGLGFFADPAFHQWMVAVCLALAVLAFVPGWRRHRRVGPVLIATGGLSLIAGAAFAGHDECCPTSATIPERQSSLAAPVELTPESAPELTPKLIASDHAGVKDAPTCAATTCGGCSSSTQTPAPTTAPAPLEVEPTTNAQLTTQASVQRSVWPWITPAGGLLLVVAHLFNRQLVCRCCEPGA